MKTYFRILSLARPVGMLVPQYVITATLAIIFGLLNIMLLIPILDVLFDQIPPDQMAAYLVKPEFEFSGEYLKNAFYHYFINFAETYGKVGSLAIICLTAVIGNLLANIFRYISMMILAKVKSRIVYKMRMLYAEKINKMHLGYFSEQRKGDVMSRVSSDISEVEFIIMSTLQVIYRDPMTIIVYFAVLFSISFKLTLFAIILLPVAGGIVSAIVKKLRIVAKDGQISLGKILEQVEEMLSGIRVIKAFNGEKEIVNKFDKEVYRYSRLTVGMARKNQLATPVSEFLGITMVAITLWFGGYLVLSEQSSLEASEFIGYIVIFVQVMNPVKSISKAYSNLQRGIVAGDRVFEIIDSHSEIQDLADAQPLDGFDEALELKNVSFAYDTKQVLQNINLRVQKGQTIALVGPSGGGKSTLADLIPRFYDPTEGEVSIDGKSLQTYTMESIRKIMGIVTQESILFNDTVHNNIAFGVPEADREQVIKAAKIANAHEFIETLDGGYDSSIGDRGSKLSGGQRQRISIARAILKNPDILILDEATSALDTESEKLVQEAITNLMKNRTSIVIAHRLSTIQHADQIVVIRDGKIEEQGTHEELVSNGGLYKKLIKLQQVD